MPVDFNGDHIDPEDFDFVLWPKKRYWFVVRSGVWLGYRKVLKAMFGKASFTTSKTEERTINGVRETWLVLDIGLDPIWVSAKLMGRPTVYNKGDSAQSTGAFETPEPHWIVEADQAVTAVKESVREVAKKAEETTEAIKVRAGKLADQLEKSPLFSPLEYMDRTAKNVSKVGWAIGFGALGLGLLWSRVTK